MLDVYGYGHQGFGCGPSGRFRIQAPFVDIFRQAIHIYIYNIGSGLGLELGRNQ